MTNIHELRCSLCGDALEVPAYVWSFWHGWGVYVCPDCQTRTMEQPGRYPVRQAGACEGVS